MAARVSILRRSCSEGYERLDELLAG